MKPEQQPYSGPPRQSQQGPGPGTPSQPTRHQGPASGLSSHGASRKRLTAVDFDRSAYTAGQTLVTVVNDPRADAAKNWGAWLGFRLPDVSWQEPAAPIDTMRYPPVTRRDLAKYLSLLSDGCYEQFQAARQSLALGGISQQLMTLSGDAGDLDDDDDPSYGLPYDGYGGTEALAPPLTDADTGPHGAVPYSRRSSAGGLGEPASTSGAAAPRPAAPRLKQGDGLVTALQVVPPLFFNEDFSLSRPDIFEAICGCEDDNEMYARIDKLNAALDVVETQLMREIASRSRAIVAAGNCVHDLHYRLSVTLAHIKRLRENVSDMDDVTYSAAVRVAQLQRRRNNLSAAVEQIKGLEEVAAAKAALPLLLESGDYAGALELLDNLSHAAAGLSASGVAAFRSLAPQLVESRAVVESLLQSEMLGAAMYTEAHLVLERAVAESAQALGLTAPLAPLSSADSTSGDGSAAAGPSASSLSREWSLRSAGSSSLLATELAAAREQLHDRLLPVVLGLHRCDRLEAALQQFAVNRAAEVKAIVREVVERLLPVHLQLAGIEFLEGGGGGGSAGGGAEGASAVGPAAAAAGGGGSGGSAHSCADGGSSGLGGGEMSLAEKLSVLPHLGFLQILMVITSMVEAYLAHTLLVGSLVEDALRSGRAPATALTAPRREVHCALQAVVDVATGRWAKLMAARSDVHSRLKVYEFRALLAACESFAALPEMHGLRPGAALRPTLQALCRAHLENTHSRCATQMQHLLEAEQWVPAEAHASFQAIVDRLEERCPGARQQQPGEQEQSQGLEGPEGPGGRALTGGAAGQQRPTEGLLRLGGRHYWPVNALLMLLKLLDEHYMGLLPAATAAAAAAAAAAGASGRRLGSGQVQAAGSGSGAAVSSRSGVGAAPAHAASWALSSVGPDVAQRCLELLRTFNTVTAQQVLGAGAMRTSGLKSISAKHLALAAQSLAALLCALPLLRWQLAGAIADAPRRALLMPEFDRLAQDLNLHVEEIHGKLVDIMQDRVLAACRQVSSDSEAWPRAAPSLQAHQVAQPVPSEALRLLARQLGTLRSVLQPILQPEEVAYIFGRVAAACSESLAGLLDSLTPPPAPAAAAAPPPPPTGLLRGLGGGGAAAAAAAAAAEAHAVAAAAWDASRRANALFMLQALAALPLDPSRASSYTTRLATFYTKHYGLLPWDAQSRPSPAAGPTAAAAAAAAKGPAATPSLPPPAGAAAAAAVAASAGPALPPAQPARADGAAWAGPASAAMAAVPPPPPPPLAASPDAEAPATGGGPAATPPSEAPGVAAAGGSGSDAGGDATVSGSLLSVPTASLTNTTPSTASPSPPPQEEEEAPQQQHEELSPSPSSAEVSSTRREGQRPAAERGSGGEGASASAAAPGAAAAATAADGLSFEGEAQGDEPPGPPGLSGSVSLSSPAGATSADSVDVPSVRSEQAEAAVDVGAEAAPVAGPDAAVGASPPPPVPSVQGYQPGLLQQQEQQQQASLSWTRAQTSAQAAADTADTATANGYVAAEGNEGQDAAEAAPSDGTASQPPSDGGGGGSPSAGGGGGGGLDGAPEGAGGGAPLASASAVYFDPLAGLEVGQGR